MKTMWILLLMSCSLVESFKPRLYERIFDEVTDAKKPEHHERSASNEQQLSYQEFVNGLGSLSENRIDLGKRSHRTDVRRPETVEGVEFFKPKELETHSGDLDGDRFRHGNDIRADVQDIQDVHDVQDPKSINLRSWYEMNDDRAHRTGDPLHGETVIGSEKLERVASNKPRKLQPHSKDFDGDRSRHGEDNYAEVQDPIKSIRGFRGKRPRFGKPNVNINYNTNVPYFLGSYFNSKWIICSGYVMDIATQLCCHGNLYTKQAFKKCCGGELYHVMTQNCVSGSVVNKKIPKCGSDDTYDFSKEFCYQEKLYSYDKYLECDGQLYLL